MYTYGHISKERASEREREREREGEGEGEGEGEEEMGVSGKVGRLYIYIHKDRDIECRSGRRQALHCLGRVRSRRVSRCR